MNVFFIGKSIKKKKKKNYGICMCFFFFFFFFCFLSCRSPLTKLRQEVSANGISCRFPKGTDCCYEVSAEDQS